MAWQQTDLDTLDAAIAQGIKKVRYSDGREVDYQDVDKMTAARKVVAATLKAQSDALAGRRRRRFAAYRSGF